MLNKVVNPIPKNKYLLRRIAIGPQKLFMALKMSDKSLGVIASDQSNRMAPSFLLSYMPSLFLISWKSSGPAPG